MILKTFMILSKISYLRPKDLTKSQRLDVQKLKIQDFPVVAKNIEAH